MESLIVVGVSRLSLSDLVGIGVGIEIGVGISLGVSCRSEKMGESL